MMLLMKENLSDPAGGKVPSVKIGYLLSEHPVISHTFIDREIHELERRGHHVEIVAIRRPKSVAVLGMDGERWLARTFYVLRSWRRVFGAIWRLSALGANWKCMISTWLRAVQKRPFRLSSYAYIVEAIIVVDRMSERGVAHVHNHFGNAAGTVAAIAAASHLVKFSLSIHGPDIFYNVESDMLAEKIKWAAFVRCISWFSKSQLCLLSSPEQWGKFDIVRCGVEPAVFSERGDPKNEVPVVLCVGRLVAAKGQAVLLEASGILWRSGLAHKLRIVGSGPDEQALLHRVVDEGWEHVTFTGAMAQDGVRNEFARADLFVLASFAEGVPVVLMEAMACSIPVISTRIAGIPELIEDGKNGILVSPGDAYGLARAMQGLIEDPDRRVALGSAAREKVLREYSIEQSGAAMADLFERNLASAA